MQKRPYIQYDTDTVNKYWDDPNYRIFCIKQENDGTFCYVSSNPTNNRLKNIRIGAAIQECIAPHFIDMMSQNYRNLILEQTAFSYLSLQSDGHFWETTIEARGRFLYGIGTKLESTKQNEPLIKDAEPLQQYSVQDDLFFCAILRKHENSYVIDSLDGSPETKDIQNLFVGQDINILLKLSSNISDYQIIEKSLAENRIIQYDETINRSHFTISVIPLVSLQKVIIKAISRDGSTSVHLPKPKTRKSFFFPSCTIMKNDAGQYLFVQQNSLFEKVILSSGIVVEEITKSVAFQTCQSTLATTFSTLQKQQDGTSLTVFLEYMPTIFQGSQLATLCYLSREQDLDKITYLHSFLSKRESEVFSLILDGYSNHGIANVLNISTGTVKKLVYNCFKKLGVSTRFELVEFIYSD